MKTIADYVNSLNEEELKKLATKHVSFLVKKPVYYLFVISQDIKNGKDPSRNKEGYGGLKRYLRELDLWDQRYEEHYVHALKGEFDKEELDKIIIK